MGTVQDHLDQARHNLDFLQSFDKEVFSDWTVTVCFYVAVHFANALIQTRKPMHPGNHADRERELAGLNEWRLIYADYCELSNKSQKARYDGYRFNSDRRQRLQNRLDRLIQAVTNELHSRNIPIDQVP